MVGRDRHHVRNRERNSTMVHRVVVESHCRHSSGSLFSVLQRIPGVTEVGTILDRGIRQYGRLHNHIWNTGMVADGHRVGRSRGDDDFFGDAKAILSRCRLAKDQPWLAEMVGDAAYPYQRNNALC